MDGKMCGCGCEDIGHGVRGFLTKEEKLDILKGYKKELENEAKGVEERIKQLEKNN